MNSLLPALLLLGLADARAAVPPPIAPATIDNHLEITGERIKARAIDTRLAVPVWIDGQGPFRFIVDSGADRSVIGSALAVRLALPPGPPALLHGMAGASTVTTVRLDRLKLGASTIPDIVAPALAENDLGAQGLIGIDALAEQRLAMDFDAKTITVEDARRPPPARAPDEVIVTARRRKGQLILTNLEIGTQSVYAVIDTGAQVTIGNAALRARLFAGRAPPQVTPVQLVSVTGEVVTADLIVLPRLRLGGIELRAVPVAFADAPPFRMFGLADDPAVLLGTDVLEAFHRVSLDFRRRKVRFTLRDRDRVPLVHAWHPSRIPQPD